MSVHFGCGFFGLGGFFFSFFILLLVLFQGSFLSEIFAVSAWHWQFSVLDNGGLVFWEFPFI